MEKGDRVYYCEVVPNCSIYEVLELVIRTVADNYYVGVDHKTNQAHIFTNDMINQYIFTTRHEALDALKEFRND